MVGINLLNWREKLRIILNSRFYVLAGTVAVSCMVMTFFVYGFVGGLISSQGKDIAYIDMQMKGVDEKIKELKDLQNQKALLLERQKVIESLQDSRPFVVRLFDGIVRIIPDGVVIDEMSRKENELTLKGTSDSNATIAKMMSNVQQLKWVKEASLGELKTTKTEKNSNEQPNSTVSVGGGLVDNAQTTVGAENNSGSGSSIGFELKITLNVQQAGG